MARSAEIPKLSVALRGKDWRPGGAATVKFYDGYLTKRNKQPISKLYDILSYMKAVDVPFIHELFMPEGREGQAYARAVKVATDGLTEVIPLARARYPQVVMDIATTMSKRINDYIESKKHLSKCPRILPEELIFLNTDNAAEVAMSIDDIDSDNHELPPTDDETRNLVESFKKVD